jgi:uncharacterized protein
MTNLATIKRHAERAVPDEAADILSHGLVAHVGFCQDGQPIVIPLAYHYDPATPDIIYLHGSVAGRTLRHIATGHPVCITVTMLDGLVYSRAAESHSINYRCAVCFGRGVSILSDAEKEARFAAMTSRYIPGRTVGEDYTPPTAAQLRGVLMVAVQIEEMSAKARRGDPLGPLDNDPTAPGSSGVVDL